MMTDLERAADSLRHASDTVKRLAVDLLPKAFHDYDEEREIEKRQMLALAVANMELARVVYEEAQESEWETVHANL